MSVVHLSTKDEFHKLLNENHGKLIAIDFTAKWCGPCQRIGPFFVKLAEDPANSNVIFAKVDVDENSETSEECGVRCMPTFMFYKEGKKVHEFSGASEENLVQAITSNK